MKLLLATIPMIFILSGCVDTSREYNTFVISDVTAMSDETHFVSGKTKIYISTDNQKLEQKKYNSIITDNLERKGFVVTNDKNVTPYHLSYNYSIDSGKMYNRSISEQGTINTAIAYTRNLEIKIYKNEEEVYFTKVISSGSSRMFSEVAECLINAALWDFPKDVSNQRIHLLSSVNKYESKIFSSYYNVTEIKQPCNRRGY